MNNFGSAIRQYWVNYANFKGRTSKTMFWWAVLFVFLANAAINAAFPAHMTTNMFMDMRFTEMTDSGMSNLWSIATFIPNLSMLVRRLQDTGRSGTNAWFILLPVVGWILLLMWTLQPGQPGANKDGDAPLS